MLRPWPVVLVAAACAGPARQAAPPPPPLARPVARPMHAAAVARASVIGFVCPEAAAGRTAFLAAALRREREWTTDPRQVRDLLARGAVRELDVLGFAGRRAGRFMPVGPVDLGGGVAALGAYAGAAPCADKETAAECQAVTGGCGLAAGAAGLDEAPRLPARGGCAAGGQLFVDIDGDGVPEGFRLADLAAFPDELSAARGAAGCTARFAGPLGDGIDLLGVADLDLDGRFEIAIGRHAADGRREAAIYSATQNAGALERVAVIFLQ
jgi:hypothetical protein